MSSLNLNDLLQELLALGKETEWVEFKHNNGKPDEIGEYCSALANSAVLHDKNAAFLVFGVDNASLAVVGTTVCLDQVKVGNQELENWIATQLDPRVDFKFLNFEFEGKPIWIVQIDRPRLKPVAFKGVEYIRVGSYKKQLKEFPEKERKIWEKLSLDRFEKRIAADGLRADDVAALLDFQKYFDLMSLPFPSTRDGMLERFVEEELICKRVDGAWQITNLGAILFAKNLKEFDRLKRKAVRVIQYKGTNRLNAIKEQEGAKGYATGFEGLLSYINDQLPMNEEIGQALRKEVKVYPEIAIRELAANMLIHQDFDVSGTGPTVEIFSDRIEFTNPGTPLIPALRFIDFNPQSRNESLAAFMRRIRVCEERGSGIDKVVDATEVFQLPAPNFVAEESFFKVELFSPRTLRQMNKDDKIRTCYQHCCLKFVSGSVMTNESLRKRLGIEEQNYSIASRIIADALDAKLIRPQDPENKSRRMASYVPYWA